MVHILLVEDNPGDVLMAREAIQTYHSPVDVVVASDGEEALTVINHYRFEPDILFLDLNLPKLTGFHVLERLRSHSRPRIVVFTSSSNPEHKKRAIELGACEYIIKPLELAEYMRAVTATLERRLTAALTRGL